MAVAAAMVGAGMAIMAVGTNISARAIMAAVIFTAERCVPARSMLLASTALRPAAER